MATFFGEVLQSSSRAIDEDDDEEEIPEVQCSTVLRWSVEARKAIAGNVKAVGAVPQTNVIISIGQAATGFTQAYIIGNNETELLGVICSGLKDKEVNTFAQEAFTDHNCYIYRLKDEDNVIVVQCKVNVPPEQYFSWTEVLFSDVWKLFKNEDTSRSYVSVLASATVSEYKSDGAQGDLQLPFLRQLNTTNYCGNQVCPYLETPNTVSGLPAQILSHCEMRGTNAVLYTCYTDVGCMADSNAMKAFIPITQSYSLREHIQINPKADKEVVKLAKTLEQHSTLYI